MNAWVGNALTMFLCIFACVCVGVEYSCASMYLFRLIDARYDKHTQEAWFVQHNNARTHGARASSVG